MDRPTAIGLCAGTLAGIACASLWGAPVQADMGAMLAFVSIAPAVTIWMVRRGAPQSIAEILHPVNRTPHV